MARSRTANNALVGFVFKALLLSATAVALPALPAVGIALQVYYGSRNHASLHRTVRQMERNGYLATQKIGKTKYLLLTESGRRAARMQNLTLPPQTGAIDPLGWFAVSFDIPEAKRLARKALSKKLQELGFVQFQKSMYVYPRSCKTEIEFIREYFNAKKHIRYYFISSFEPETEKMLRARFAVRNS